MYRPSTKEEKGGNASKAAYKFGDLVVTRPSYVHTMLRASPVYTTDAPTAASDVQRESIINNLLSILL